MAILEEKKLFRMIGLALGLSLSATILIFIIHSPIDSFVFEPIQKFVFANMTVIRLGLFGIFVFGSLSLMLLVNLLEWDDKKNKYVIKPYKSKVVALDYYTENKRVDFYRAIKHTLTKLGNTKGLTDEDNTLGTRGAVPVREYYQKRDYAVRYSLKELKDEYVPGVRDRIIDRSDGIRKLYYENGAIEREISFQDGHLEGYYRTYYEDGQPYQEMHYKAGKLHGVFRAFDENGNLYFEMNFLNGKKEGKEFIYFNKGVIEFENTYQNGERIHRKTFNEAGKLIYDHEYHEGIEEI